MHNHGSFFSGGVPVFETIDLISNQTLGEGAATALGDAAAVLLRGNGQVTVGRTIPEAVMMAIYLEEAAQVLFGAMQVGTPQFLPREAAGSRQQEALPPPDMERAWNFFKRPGGDVATASERRTGASREDTLITIAEEMVLLMLDYDSGRNNTRLRSRFRRKALSGAVLMDLALENRIDTDKHDLFVIDPTPSAEPASARVLARIAAEKETRPIHDWVELFAQDYATLHLMLTDRLVQRRILLRQRGGRLWFLGLRDVTDGGKPVRDVRQRIAAVLLSHELPDPRDAMIISLAEACALWPGLLDETAVARIEHRIAQIARMDFIGQWVAHAIQEHLDW